MVRIRLLVAGLFVRFLIQQTMFGAIRSLRKAQANDVKQSPMSNCDEAQSKLISNPHTPVGGEKSIDSGTCLLSAGGRMKRGHIIP